MIEHDAFGQSETLEAIQAVHRPVRNLVNGHHADTPYQTAVTYHGPFADIYMIT